MFSLGSNLIVGGRGGSESNPIFLENIFALPFQFFPNLSIDFRHRKIGLGI